MQAATIHRVAGRLGIVAATRQPLMTLVVPLIYESVHDNGCLNAYASDAVELIAADYLPVNRPFSEEGNSTDARN